MGGNVSTPNTNVTYSIYITVNYEDRYHAGHFHSGVFLGHIAHVSDFVLPRILETYRLAVLSSTHIPNAKFGMDIESEIDETYMFNEDKARVFNQAVAIFKAQNPNSSMSFETIQLKIRGNFRVLADIIRNALQMHGYPVGRIERMATYTARIGEFRLPTELEDEESEEKNIYPTDDVHPVIACGAQIYNETTRSVLFRAMRFYMQRGPLVDDNKYVILMDSNLRSYTDSHSAIEATLKQFMLPTEVDVKWKDATGQFLI